jgi:hypothetical protein
MLFMMQMLRQEISCTAKRRNILDTNHQISQQRHTQPESLQGEKTDPATGKTTLNGKLDPVKYAVSPRSFFLTVC